MSTTSTAGAAPSGWLIAPIGIVSIGDLVKATISNQQFIISQLEHYITG